MDRVRLLVEPRDPEGGGTLVVALVGVRGLPGEQLHHLQVALPGGHVQGQVPSGVHPVGVRPVLEQHPHRVVEPPAGGVVQHGESAGRVSRVGVGSGPEQLQDQGGVAGLCHLDPDTDMDTDTSRTLVGQVCSRPEDRKDVQVDPRSTHRYLIKADKEKVP